MSTSQTTGLSEPVGTDKISIGTLGYVRARHRQRQYDLVIREFKKSGLTQADLARRLGKSPEVISRLLARPSNWEADTFADLLFATSGAVAKIEVVHLFTKSTADPIHVSLGLEKLTAIARTQGVATIQSQPSAISSGPAKSKDPIIQPVTARGIPSGSETIADVFDTAA
jgi:transcriptional regulator with XRE-family HTH domain